MKKGAVLSIVLLIFCRLTVAGQQSFHVLEDSSRQLTPAAVLNAWQNGAFKPLQPAYLNPGYTTSHFWIAVTAPDVAFAENMLLVADNPHINRLEWYAAGRNSMQLLSLTGDYFPFDQRPVRHPSFVFRFSNGPGLYLLKIDKHHESLQAPFRLESRAVFRAESERSALINGILTGIVLLIVLFGAFLYANTRDAVYGWYALYVLSTLGWIWSNSGLGFQYLWPESEYFPSRSRVVFVFANFVLTVQFLKVFTGLGQPGSRLRQPLLFAQGVWLAMLIITLWPINYQQYAQATMVLLRALPFFSLAALGLLLAGLIYKVVKGNRPSMIYIAAVLVLMFFTVMENLYHLGTVKLPSYFAHYGLFTGIVLEMIIITFGLAARFSFYRKEKEAILQKMNEQQKQLTDTIVTVEENERKVLADRLHDEIGSLLALASLQLDAVKGNPMQGSAPAERASGIIKEISETVRNISHQLTPVAMEKYGLVKAVTDLAGIANASGRIRIELVIIGFENDTHYSRNFRVILYRIIQELLQNVLRHADAGHVLIQLIEHEDHCTLMVEDDGKGFSGELPAPQLLRSIRSKVDYLEGMMQIEHQTESGALINIELPLPKMNGNYV
ncbi:7TM diverse intracellular signaling domain-containing protein [Chitinophaga sp.]|uniref:sensor histidine kinase n=1 Tax=Chitinophaga sp. TaxID=1869181 RepID=UPI0026047C27|nr:7TM diverse intracellular signaling domain-containing protein [uncultured Chitinophaga sp.]